ncbi:MAG: PspC domain-containing protein [Planctomycetia bacterium]|jgi:phage shock protein PspC (stress-responsive transcriptional regulator)
MISAVQAAPSKELWLYSRDGERFGPTDLGGLRKMASCRHVLPETLVWSEGLPAWIPAATIETLVFPPQEPPEPGHVMEPAMDSVYTGLYRSSDERVVLGVCAGIAHKWKVPLLAVRIAMVILSLFLVGWAYFVGAFLPPLPTRRSKESAAQ